MPQVLQILLGALSVYISYLYQAVKTYKKHGGKTEEAGVCDRMRAFGHVNVITAWQAAR